MVVLDTPVVNIALSPLARLLGSGGRDQVTGRQPDGEAFPAV